jgi:hypothetical protein
MVLIRGICQTAAEQEFEVCSTAGIFLPDFIMLIPPVGKSIITEQKVNRNID